MMISGVLLTLLTLTSASEISAADDAGLPPVVPSSATREDVVKSLLLMTGARDASEVDEMTERDASDTLKVELVKNGASPDLAMDVFVPPPSDTASLSDVATQLRAAQDLIDSMDAGADADRESAAPQDTEVALAPRIMSLRDKEHLARHRRPVRRSTNGRWDEAGGAAADGGAEADVRSSHKTYVFIDFFVCISICNVTRNLT